MTLSRGTVAFVHDASLTVCSVCHVGVVRRYFTLDIVLNGVTGLLEEMFGLEMRRQEPLREERWTDSQVIKYTVHQHGQQIAYVAARVMYDNRA